MGDYKEFTEKSRQEEFKKYKFIRNVVYES